MSLDSVSASDCTLAHTDLCQADPAQAEASCFMPPTSSLPIPAEICQLILGYLGDRELAHLYSLMQTCRAWRLAILDGASTMWERKARAIGAKGTTDRWFYTYLSQYITRCLLCKRDPSRMSSKDRNLRLTPWVLEEPQGSGLCGICWGYETRQSPSTHYGVLEFEQIPLHIRHALGAERVLSLADVHPNGQTTWRHSTYQPIFDAHLEALERHIRAFARAPPRSGDIKWLEQAESLLWELIDGAEGRPCKYYKTAIWPAFKKMIADGRLPTRKEFLQLVKIDEAMREVDRQAHEQLAERFTTFTKEAPDWARRQLIRRLDRPYDAEHEETARSILATSDHGGFLLHLLVRAVIRDILPCYESSEDEDYGMEWENSENGEDSEQEPETGGQERDGGGKDADASDGGYSA